MKKPGVGSAAWKKYATVLIALLVAAATITPLQSIAEAAGNSNTTAVNGRVLSKTKAGDSSDWVEIARNGNYSLILRKDVLPLGFVDFPASGINNIYRTSNARNVVNDWYNCTLSYSARIRSFAVTNNALTDIGYFSALNQGISKPSGTSARTGDDVAFLLSFGEAASFCSMQYATSSSSWVASSANARANFAKLTPLPSVPAARDFWWLRSPGQTGTDTSSIGSHNPAMANCVWSSSSVAGRGYCYIRPALWVSSGIFESDTATIRVIHKDASFGTILLEETFVINVSDSVAYYGPYTARTFFGYGNGFLAPGSAPASGTVRAQETVTITFQYLRWIS
jgi:hypothetical protein